jgi:RHS repeat-associated protein
MAYDGLGGRLSMTGYTGGQSVTTHYELDGGRVLSATAGDLTTTYLYGLGPIGELTDSWAYTLPDGTNAPRQLVDASGKITLVSSYTSWGDTLSVNGTGNFTWGYYGGIMDTATGLLYVGNGQYYDPSTGRFLNRNARPDQANPYLPWKQDPASALMAPLALLALIYCRKKGKRSKWDNLIFLLVLALAVSTSLVACGNNDQQQTTHTVTVTQTPTETTATLDGSTVIARTPTTMWTASNTPSICTYTLTPTATPTLPGGYGNYSYYWYGITYYDILDRTPGFWHELGGRPFGMETFVAIVLNYELDGMSGSAEASIAVAESFARRFWQAQKDYGPYGAYWYLGGREMVMRRARNNAPGINIDDYSLDNALQLTEQIFNNASWHEGEKLERPFEWGNTDFTSKEIQNVLPRFWKALESGNKGPNSDQVWFIQQEFNLQYFFVVTRGQNWDLCDNKSCVKPLGLGG